jgi:TPP-dependent indolepyruvate ferredoxin oxidoreductase alpha subunit
MTAKVTGDYFTTMRPVSNCAGCGDTKISYAIKEGLRRFNKGLKEEGRRYELIYVADRGCGNLQGYWEYGIVDVILNMGSAMMVGEGIKAGCGEQHLVVTASGDGAYNFNMSAFKFAAKNKNSGTIAVIYNNHSIRMTGGQLPLEIDFRKEGEAMGYEVIFANPFQVEDNARLFQALYPRYVNRDKIMVVADGVCVVDLGREARERGLRLGHFQRNEECLDLKFEQERQRLAREEPEKLADLPPFKCRLCGIQLRCQALLNDSPEMCLACGACSQFPCPTQSLSMTAPHFALSTCVADLLSAESPR